MQILSVVLGESNGVKTSTIRANITTKNLSSRGTSQATKVITLSYDYTLGKASEENRLLNPLGFKVLTYRIDNEQKMKKIILASLLLGNFVWALNVPKTSTFDKRIAYAVYNADDVFQINSKNGYVSVLEFGIDERIINTATGFAEGWDLTQKDNLLFIKPKAYKTQLVHQDENNTAEQQSSQEFVVDPNPYDWKTNLIVITNLNTYVFDLKLVANNKNTTYKLSFSYPQKIYKQPKNY